MKGYENSYHDVVRRRLVSDSDFIGFADFHSTVSAVHSGAAHKGLMAVYNSIYGSTQAYTDIRRNFDGLVVTAELYLDISHQLLGDSRAAAITEIRSDPIAIRQCAETIHRLYPSARLVESDDTARSAYEVADLMQQDVTGVAALAGIAARNARPELDIIKSRMQDESPNITRFLLFEPILGDTSVEDYIPTDASKTSTLLTIPNTQASLVGVLQAFSEQGISFSYVDASSDRIDSMGETLVVPFDFLASWNDPATQAAIEKLQTLSVSVKLIGSYKAGATISG